MYAQVRNGFLEGHTVLAAIILRVLSRVLLTSIYIAIWQAIYWQKKEFPLSLSEFISYSIYSMVLTTLYSTGLVSFFSDRVKSGDIIFNIIRPKPLLLQMFYPHVGRSLFNIFYITLPSFGVLVLFNYSYLVAHRVFLFLLALVFSYVFMFLIDMIFGLVSIFSLNSWGLESFKSAMILLLSGQFIPLGLYPPGLQRIVLGLPFSKLYSFPLSLILNQGTFTFKIFLEYVFTISLCCLFYFLLQKILFSRIQVNGS